MGNFNSTNNKAAAGSLTGTALNPAIITSSLTSVGTLLNLNVAGDISAPTGALDVAIITATYNATLGGGGIGVYSADGLRVFFTADIGSNLIAIGDSNSSTSVYFLGNLNFGNNIKLGANSITMTGSIGATAARVTKGWFSALECSSAIVASITGSAPTLTTTRAIYGNNFDGSAALNQIIASTYGGTGNGFTKFIGPATTERVFTLPDSAATLLYSGGALGTPSSGVATNLTGTASSLTSGITNALKSATTTVDVSAATAPSAGQVLTATDSTHATWQALSASLPSGAVLQTVSATTTNTSTVTGTAFATTGLTASITPSSTSNKVLVTITWQGSSDTSSLGFLKLLRGSTPICIGDAAGSRLQVSALVYTSDTNGALSASISFLDSPSSTSSTTYTLHAASASGGASIFTNRSNTDPNSSSGARFASTITLQEIKG